VGTLRAVDGTGIVRMEDRYDTDIHDLWSALTEPTRLTRWIADIDGDLSVGGEFHASFTSGWEGRGRVDVCEPPRRLRVTIAPGQGGDETVIEAELVAEGDHTRLVIEERGLPSMSSPGTGRGGRPTSMTSPPTSTDGRALTGALAGPSSLPPTVSCPMLSSEIRRLAPPAEQAELDAPPAGNVPAGMADEIHNVRTVVLHVVEETARHAGHLDIARELIDGRTGLGSR
jgi:uncharacterized protein YndB with AHSA1/START domain